MGGVGHARARRDGAAARRVEQEAHQFQKLLLIRAVRPDRITSALSLFVEKTMGSEYVNQEAFDARKMFEESGPSTPIFFVLFPGYSPSKDIEKLANEMGKSSENGKLTIISMGQGQEPVAEAVLDNTPRRVVGSSGQRPPHAGLDSVSRAQVGNCCRICAQGFPLLFQCGAHQRRTLRQDCARVHPTDVHQDIQ